MNERLTAARIRNRTMPSLYRTKAEWFPTELIPGRILREDIRAASDIPDTDAAACDGYACGELELPGILKMMGNSSDLLLADAELSSGECARIRKHEPVPAGTKRIVHADQVIRIDEEHISVRKLHPDRMIIGKGRQRKLGDLILKSGEKLTAQHAALLAVQQKERVLVSLPPKTAVTMIREQSGQRMNYLHGGILQLQAHFRDYGLSSVHERMLSDTPEEMMRRLQGLSQRSDAVIVLTHGRQTFSMLVELLRKEPELLCICSNVNAVPDGGIAVAKNASGGIIAAVDYSCFFLLVMCEEIFIPILHAMQGAVTAEPQYIYLPLRCIDIMSAYEHGLSGLQREGQAEAPWETFFPVSISRKGIQAEAYSGSVSGTAADGYVKISSDLFSRGDDFRDSIVPLRILKK